MAGSGELNGRLERLRPPRFTGRRQGLGQHFTSSHVADLINAFCIRSPRDRVLDPACGNGAILERARARLAHLGGDAGQLTGVELDPGLAAEARTFLPGAEILTADFLQLDEGRLGQGAFDAVVGNPPYVRQERLTAARKLALPALTRGRDGDPRFSARSDLHVYFWPLALSVLREGGRLGFLTSNSWLDASYGDALRRWLGAMFRVVAVIDSRSESWFSEARVRTVITIVERTRPREEERARFIRLERRLDEIAPEGTAEAERLARFDRLARKLERSAAGSKRVSMAGGGGTVRGLPARDLVVQRWGPALRQPGLYDEILSRAGGRLVPLSSVATVSWGIKTGDDRFFYVSRDDPPPVEAEYLRPVVFNLMELDRVVVTRGQLGRLALLVDLRTGQEPGPKLLRHIRKGERERACHLRPTCAARERGGDAPRRWFELRPGPPGEILWSIMHQYRHLAPWNPQGFPANDNLLLIRPKEGIEPRLLAALLNSHVQALIKHAHGRSRNEGMLKTQACDVKGMLVPDPGRLTPRIRRRLLEAFDRISLRRVGKVHEECREADRRALDAAVLLALGYHGAEADRTAGRLSTALTGIYRHERAWERDAVSRRRRKE